MRNAIQRWFAKNSQSSPSRLKADPRNQLKGGVDLITPSIISGWAWHPEFKLYDVRLLSGTNLIATAMLDIHREDVEERVGDKGSHAFNLRIPADIPPVDASTELQLVALTVDSSRRFPLSCMKDKTLTQALLKAALNPMYLGMQGHFDGLTSDGLNASGWCFQSLRPHEICTVYLQIEGIEPIPIRCEHCRPGFAGLGYPEYCGFAFRLDDLSATSEVGGKSITVSFDEKGLLPLPQSAPCLVPPQSVPGKLSLPAASPSEPSEGLLESTALNARERLAYPISQDFARYWSELEEFKRLCDVFEQEIVLRMENEACAQRAKVWRISSWKKMFRRRA